MCFFVDYGSIEVIAIEDMRKELFMTELPIQCFPLQLENIHPLADKWERSVLEFLDSTVVDQTLLVTVSRVEIGPNNQDRYWGTLTATRAGMDIWLLLVKNGYARSEG